MRAAACIGVETKAHWVYPLRIRLEVPDQAPLICGQVQRLEDRGQLGFGRFLLGTDGVASNKRGHHAERRHARLRAGFEKDPQGCPPGSVQGLNNRRSLFRRWISRHAWGPGNGPSHMRHCAHEIESISMVWRCGGLVTAPALGLCAVSSPSPPCI
jgi:hypothetical protein